MPRYKHGKRNRILTFQQVKQKVLQVGLPVNEEAFFWLLYYCGVRKSEAYERVAEDFVVTENRLIVDFHQRKKHGETVDPLELPIYWYGIDKLVATVAIAKRKRASVKAVYVQANKKKVRIPKRAKWVFPKIQSTKAWTIVKKVLGEGYYPHFLRLNRLTEIGSDPTASLTRLKSFSGIKSIKSLSAYLGTSKKEQEKAIEFMDRKYA